MTIPTEPRPIGFWLKLVDRLLDERLGVALGDLTRRHWQVLNVVQQGPVNQAGIDERARPFLTAGATTTSEAEDLIARGWVSGADVYTLTELGRLEFQRLLEKVSEDRAQAMTGVPPEDYSTTVTTLERVARNLGWTGT
jgi:DNA-binding MarR family transcriptional regulator